MPYNKYGSRYSSRYSTPGRFVPGGQASRPAQSTWSSQPYKPKQSYQPSQPSEHIEPNEPERPQPPPSVKPPIYNQEMQPKEEVECMSTEISQMQTEDVKEVQPKDEEDPNTDMAVDGNNSDDGNLHRRWIKSRPAVKKLSNKERRRRQNESLRRLLSPKNALMVLNEMVTSEQLASFRVDPVANNAQYFKPHAFVADLKLEGQTYQGFGDNKLTARNAAAEQAIRDLVIKKMTKVLNAEAGGESLGDEDDTLPMMQLASFALHKLFCEWEVEGHKVPQLRPLGMLENESLPRQKRLKQLPANAPYMHPCMLLTFMRPSLEYRELATHGDRPQNMLYTVGVDVDGSTYVGTAQNKKEARKAAARAACKDLFGVDFKTIPIEVPLQGEQVQKQEQEQQPDQQQPAQKQPAQQQPEQQHQQ